MDGRREYYADYGAEVYVNRYAYNNTSEAYVLYPEEYQLPVRRKKTVTKPKKGIKKVDECLPMGIAKIITLVVVVAALSVTFVCVRAGNNVRRRELVNMQANLDVLKDNNAYLEARLNESLDLKRIEDIAKTRLGMSKPRSYQIKYIDVTKENYTVRYEDEPCNEKSFFELIANLFD